MKNEKSALRYAKAILNLATSKNVDTEINQDMALIAQTIAENRDLDIMLKSPIIKSADKTKVLNTLFGDKVNNITKGVFTILQDNKRLAMLETVAKRYAIVYDYHKSIQEAKVTTAVALTKELEQKIQDKIVELTGNKATINNTIDASIIGGFILQVGDVQYDASIANQLNELRKEFDNSHYISKI